MGFGMNGTSMLVTRGCKEVLCLVIIAMLLDCVWHALQMNRLAIAMGAAPHTLTGLAGIGDLMLSCFGSLSRNRTVGVRLGKGETVAEVLASMTEVAEGVATAPAAMRLAEQYGIDAPIVTIVARVVAGESSARDGLMYLMQLPAKDGDE